MFENHARLNRRILAFIVAGALGVAGTAVAAAPAAVQFSVLTKATQLGQDDVVQSVTPLNQPIRVSVVLKLRDEAQMRAFLARSRSLSMPTRQVMTPAQLQGHLPTAAQAEAVADYLKGAGFSNVSVSSNRMIVNATGTAAVVQSAFKTSLVNVRTHDGRAAFANNSPIRIPAALQDTVQAVLGLQTVHKAHTLKTHVGFRIGAHFPQEFADIYNASDLPPASDVAVAVWGWGSMAQTIDDLDTFITANGLQPVDTHVVCTDINGIDPDTAEGLGGTSIGDPACNGNVDQGSIEWDMDSQIILGMTGGVKSMTFYAAYGAYNTTVTDALNEIVNPTVGEPLPRVINASFGECERYQDANQGGDGSMQADDALFQIGVAQGQTFSVSTGDFGADECGFGNPRNSASYPASSPWVVAASGTTLLVSANGWANENVWLDSGGSPSSAEAAQPWQAGLTYGTFAGARGPDVAFDGNPSSGAVVLNDGNYYQVGGTSLSAPLFAGAWARILQTNPGLGFAAPYLYTLPASVLHDVISGTNHGYSAKLGWDWATGLGSFKVDAAASALSGQ